MINPSVILLVGPSGSGKTTFSNAIKDIDNYVLINDVDALNEMFYIENLHSKCGGLVEGYQRAGDNLIFFRDYFEELLNFERLKKYRTSSNGDGYDILDYKVWDDILLKTVEMVNPHNKYVFEFSRGFDSNYISSKNISYEDTYMSAILIILSKLQKKGILIGDILIINITSSFDSRLNRNFIRKQRGDHYISEDTMRNLYMDDLFTIGIKIESNFGYLSDGYKIPIYKINNPDLEEDKLLDYFIAEYHRAIDVFNLLTKNN